MTDDTYRVEGSSISSMQLNRNATITWGYFGTGNLSRNLWDRARRRSAFISERRWMLMSGGIFIQKMLAVISLDRIFLVI